MHKKQKINLINLLIGMLCIFASCNTTKNLQDGQYMLTKNKVIADKKEVPTKDILYVVRPITNKKFLGLFFWKAGIYQTMMPTDTTKDNKAKQWMRKNFGEPIILLDSTLIEYSTSQIQLYMFNKGYFQSNVNYKIDIKRKKAKITYSITAGIVCKINLIKYKIYDPNIAEIVLNDTGHCLVKKGNNYDVDVFSEERERITNLLNNQGYYDFNENYIVYKIDSNLTDYTVNVIILINNPIYKEGENTIERNHRKFYINEITIFSGINNNENTIDTIYYTEIVKKKNKSDKKFYHFNDTNNYKLFYLDKIDYKPKALVYPISFSQGDLYSADDAKHTYNRYVDMQNFSFIKISYEESDLSKKNYMADSGFVDCIIQLSKLEANSFHADLLGKNIGKDFGMGTNISWTNRNIFKSGEIFTITGMYTNEFQRQTDENEIKRWMFRNFEVGGDIGLEFSRFLFPIKQQNISKNIRAKTILNIGTNYQLQDHYSRFITNTGFRYQWSTSPQITHILSVLNIYLVKIYPDSVFKKEIRTLNQHIQEKYKDHLLLGTTYQLIFNSLKENTRKNYYLIRFYADAYGNILYQLFALFNAAKNENNQYNFWGIPFANYVSVNIDMAYNIMLGKKSSFVIHSDIGLGIPTLNSKSLPFEKSFYLGGSNSMRGWRLRTLGPGSYNGSASNIESTGDIKIELNAEFRTPIYKYLHMAIFADAGNVWIFKKNEDLPGGEFHWNRFYKEIAIASGVGLRLDLSFFVIRLDAALQIYNPSKLKPMQWINKTVSLNDIIMSVGIGYPF